MQLITSPEHSLIYANPSPLICPYITLFPYQASPNISLGVCTNSLAACRLLPSSFASFCSILRSLRVVKCGVTGVTGVKGMYGLYGVNGTPVLGVPMDNLSTRRSSTVVWMPGEARGSAKDLRGRDWLVFALGLDWEVGAWERVRPGLERWGAARGSGCT